MHALKRLWAKVLTAVAAAAVGAGLALQGAGVWSPHRTVVVSLVVAAAVLAAGSTTGTAVAEFRARRLGARRDLADVTLTGTAWAIVDAVGGIDYRDLGLAAYRVQRVWWEPWRKRLHRIHRVRAQFRPVASKVRWAPGKGVIGACVSQGQVVAQDVRADYDAIWPCTEDEWDTVVPAEVRGLTFAEFLDVREKYDVVVATPVLDDSGPVTTAVGCVALDGPAGSLDRLTADDVLGLLDSTAQSLLRQTT